jgi:hypothetical protein
MGTHLTPKLSIGENITVRRMRSNIRLRGLPYEQRRHYYQQLPATQEIHESNTTGSALHEHVAALLNFNNTRAKLDDYNELEFGTGSAPDETGCSKPVGRINITDPENDGAVFRMSELADEYELNPEPNPDSTIPDLTEMVAYSSSNEVFNYTTLSEPIQNKTSDYVLIINVNMSIGA